MSFFSELFWTKALNFWFHFGNNLRRKITSFFFHFILRSNCKSCRYQYGYHLHSSLLHLFSSWIKWPEFIYALFHYLDTHWEYFFYFSKEHERNREDNFDNLDIYNNMDNPTESRSLTPYGAISGGNTGGNMTQNQTDGRSKLLLQFEFLLIFMQFQQMYLTNQFKIYRFKTQSSAFQILISETSWNSFPHNFWIN